MTFETDQEAFWSGKSGKRWFNRNSGEHLLASNLAFFARALRQSSGIESAIEFGASVGISLRAIHSLFPSTELFGVEINEDAARELAKTIPADNVFHQSLLDFEADHTYDLVLTKAVLIHINPEHLEKAYDALVGACGKYLLIAEYYNPIPVAVNYRGRTDILFKRDFCGEILDRHPSLSLIDYGFSYHRDPNFRQDDVNWFLMEKLG